MKVSSAIAAAAIAFSLALPAAARTAYVEDGAQLFSAATIASLNREIGDFERQTGKEVVVVTEPSLGGKTLKQATEETFSKQQVNGVLFYFAKAEKQDAVVGDAASKAFFPPGSFQTIHDAMRGYFRTGDFDQGITTGVNLVLAQYKSHESALPGSRSGAVATRRRSSPTYATGSPFGGGMSLIWLAIILFAGFLFIRAIFRAIAGPRVMPPGGPGVPGPGYGPGYGQTGYYGGGGGGFMSGLLGGLGGAWLGNELFNRGGGNVGESGAANAATLGDSGDASGWQSDAGQADTSGMGGGGFGDTGGGFGDSGGGGDFGGGGDSGGGW
jgi:uncharacterized protein